MNKMAQEALIVRLASKLREQKSWTGETHIQKAAYILRELAEVPFDFDYILYKHGPFSFELRDELGDMQVDGYLVLEPQSPPYGPRFDVTERGNWLVSRFENAMTRYGKTVDWIAELIGNAGVAELERLATALWVTEKVVPGGTVDERAEQLREIKRHVGREAAIEAVERIDELRTEAGQRR